MRPIQTIIIGGGGNPTTATGITAYAGGGQANATILTANYNRVDVVTTNGDSCKCQAAAVDDYLEVFNNTDADMDLYPAVGERFQNGQTLLAVNEAISIGSGLGIKLICYATGKFFFY